MSQVEIISATYDSVGYIATHLRHADHLELSVARENVDPIITTIQSFEGSDWCNVALVDGIPAVVYGLYPSDESDAGTPWMVATNDIHKIKRQFIKGSKYAVTEMLKTYSFLYNLVHVDNQISINWLTWLGFTIGDELVGPNNQFYFFWMSESCVTR